MDEHIEAVQRMQDYIATHIDVNITMADLAKVSKHSPWYSYRLFGDLLHVTPAVYIRRLRLRRMPQEAFSFSVFHFFILVTPFSFILSRGFSGEQSGDKR